MQTWEVGEGKELILDFIIQFILIEKQEAFAKRTVENDKSEMILKLKMMIKKS